MFEVVLQLILDLNMMKLSSALALAAAGLFTTPVVSQQNPDPDDGLPEIVPYVNPPEVSFNNGWISFNCIDHYIINTPLVC